LSGVGAGDQVLDIEFSAKPGVERADPPIDLLAKGGEFIDITVELLRDTLLVRSGQKHGFRDDLVERLRRHINNLTCRPYGCERWRLFQRPIRSPTKDQPVPGWTELGVRQVAKDAGARLVAWPPAR
jgi:hypothetical protein